MYNGRTAIKDEEVIEASRITKWMKETHTTSTTDMIKVVLSGKPPPPPIYKGIRKLQYDILHKRTTVVLQLPEVLATRSGPAGPMSRLAGIAPVDTHPPSARTTKFSHYSVSTADSVMSPQVGSAQRHWKSLNKAKPSCIPATKRPTIKQGNRKPCCCCLPTPMALASGGSPMFPLVVHQPASPSIWPAVQSLRRGLSTNPGATMWCVCGCS